MESIIGTKDFGFEMAERMTEVNVEVTSELGYGYGKIDAPIIEDSEARERAEQLKKYLVPVDDFAPRGCIDGRKVLQTMAGHESVIGPKLAGGNTTSALVAMELSDFFQDDKSALEHFARSAWLLERKNKPIRFHTDSTNYQNIEDALAMFTAELDEPMSLEDFTQLVDKTDFEKLLGRRELKTGCGALDGLPRSIANLSRVPLEFVDDDTGDKTYETDDEVVERLSFIEAGSRMMEDDFNAETFQSQVDRATKLVESGHFDGWSSIKVALILEKVLRSLDSTDSVLDRYEVLENDHHGFHGHTEWGVAANKIPGMTIDSTRYARETGLQVFAPDIWLADIDSAALASGPNQTTQQKVLAQGMKANQVATYVMLGNGSQRAILLS